MISFGVVTQSDCYVTVRLPTASVKRTKTCTVTDTKDPVWNESFHYRIQTQVKVRDFQWFSKWALVPPPWGKIQGGRYVLNLQ